MAGKLAFSPDQVEALDSRIEAAVMVRRAGFE